VKKNLRWTYAKLSNNVVSAVLYPQFWIRILPVTPADFPRNFAPQITCYNIRTSADPHIRILLNSLGENGWKYCIGRCYMPDGPSNSAVPDRPKPNPNPNLNKLAHQLHISILEYFLLIFWFLTLLLWNLQNKFVPYRNRRHDVHLYMSGE